MTGARGLSVGLVLLAGLSGALHAEDSPPPVRLEGPLVQPLDWGTRGLTAADIDGDGRNDLVVLNNDQAKIEILYQRTAEEAPKRRPAALRRNRWDPELSDLPFERYSIVSGVAMYAIAAGDLNADGRADLAYTSRQEPLVVRFQAVDGSFDEKIVFDDLAPSSWTSTLAIADLDANGTPNLIVLSGDGVAVFEMDGEETLREPVLYPVSGDDPRGLLLSDANADGRDDLFYMLAQEARPLRLRLVQPNGSLGPELAFAQEFTNSGVRPVGSSGQPLELASVNANTGLVEWHRLLQPSAQVSRLEDLQPRVFAAGSRGGDAAGYAVGDFDGDGRTDLLQADGDGSRVWLFRRGEDGLAAPVAFPTLAGVSAVASGRFHADDDRDWVAVFSAEDSVLGVSRYTDSGRFDFPQLIELETDALLAITAATLEPGKPAELLVVHRYDGDGFLDRLAYDPGTESFVQVSRTTLPESRRQPESVRVVDLFGDGRPEIFLPVSRDPAVLLQVDPSGALVPFAEEAPLRETLLKNLNFALSGFADVDGEAGSELLLASPGLVRVLKFTPEGSVQLIDQANTRSDEDLASVPFYRDLDGDGAAELAVYDRINGELQLLRQDQAGVFRYRRSLELGRINPRQVLHLAETNELLFLGDQRCWSLPLDRGAWSLERLRTYETDLENIRYFSAETGDLNADGLRDLVLLDGENNLIEILGQAQGGEWTSQLHFTVFERNVHYSGRTGAAQEPREILLADVTGDGLDDLIVLVHDRVLLYPQKQS
ncbi:MAG: FG-GAP repeat domain-containing protein [Opitutales bacterium]